MRTFMQSVLRRHSAYLAMRPLQDVDIVPKTT